MTTSNLTPAIRHDVVFLLDSLPEWQTLAEASPPGSQLVMLDGRRDGLAQMAAHLASELPGRVAAIHLFTHGEDGRLFLGSSTLDTEALAVPGIRALLRQMGAALAADGELLLYGCEVAAGAAGREFVRQLASLTGANVAASASPTGAAGLGGDWSLAHRTGPIHALPIQAPAYAHVLASTVFSFDAGTITGENSRTYTIKDTSSNYSLRFVTTDTSTDPYAKFHTYNDSDTFLSTSYSGKYLYLTNTLAGATVTVSADMNNDGSFGDAFKLVGFKFSDPSFMGGTNTITPNNTAANKEDVAVSNLPENIVTYTPTVAANFGSLSSLAITFDPQVFGIMLDDFEIAPSGPVAPTVTGVTSSKTNGSYKAGEVISIQVNFSEAVTVTGTPTLTLETGTTDRTVNYASGTGTSTLNFSYTVQAGDTSADLDYLGTSALAGTINATSGGTAANLTLPSPGAANSLGANKALVIDTSAPVITNVSIPNTTMKVGADVTATITVADDGGSVYTLGSGSIGGFTLGSLSRVNSTTYTATFTVTEGGTDVAAGSNIPVSLVLTDPAGNSNTAYTTAISQAGDAINAHSPTDIALSNNSVATIGGANAVVGALSGTDATSGDTFTYSLVAGGGDTNNGLFNINGSDLRVNDASTLTAGNSYSVRIRTTDAAGNTYDEAFIVNAVVGPAISSATYNAATGVLTVTGSLMEANAGANNDIAVSKLTLSGEGGVTYTLTSSDVEITSATEFSVTLNAIDRAAVNQILNKTGITSTGGTTFNLAAADDWNANVTTGDTSDATNALTVNNPTTPTITSATYDYATNVLVVTGTGFQKRAGATNDIDISKLTLTGEGDTSYTIISAADVEITSDTQFSVTLTGADIYNVEAILNKDGTASVSSTTYNLAGAEDWAVGADAAVNVADLSGNGITVSNWGAPTVTSATYDWTSGQLVLTGTNFVNAVGAANDLVASLLTLTGEGGSYTLTDSANVEITSAISATLTLSANDKLNIHGLLNKGGTQSSGAVTYNLAAADNWIAGSPAASDIADPTGNGITVSSVQTPTITSATYDSDTGMLTVTGTNLFKKVGATNDIDISTLTFTGGTANTTYTLTSASDVEITSATSFSVTLSGADKTSVDALLDQMGTTSSGGSTYNLAAAEDWLAGAEAAANIADASNAVTVSISPRITSAAYNATTGVLVVTGTNIQANGSGADIDASQLTLTGEGGATYTLTDTSDVERDSATQFTLTLSATDKAALNQILNQNGTTATGGTAFNLAAADDWCTNVTAGDTADATNAVTASNVAVPAITSATYDASTGVLVVTGTGFLKKNGAANDIDVSKLTIAGEGGETRTLTTGSVEITSGTEFTVTLNAADLAAINQILNQAGTSATGGATYNLAAAEDWAAGAAAAVNVADLTLNGITVSNPTTPTIASATYDTGSGVLTVTGTGFFKLDGAANDIIANKFTVTGKAGGTYALTDSTNVEIASGTSFSLTLSVADKAAVNALLDKDGTSATDATTYNLNAAEDWAAGANAVVNVVDASNPITVSVYVAPPPSSGGGSTPPPSTPSTPTGTFDGVTIGATTETTASGSTITTVTVPVVSDTRVDDPGTVHNTHADIPLARDAGGATVIQVSVPTGVGLSAQTISGSSNATRLTLREILVAASDPKVPNTEVFHEVLQRGIDTYVPSVADEQQVTVRSITLTAAPGATQAPGTPIIITGASGTGESDLNNPDRQEALVIDARALPSGSVLQLDNVEFAIVIGASRVIGGNGRNFAVGDDSRQFIVLGADDDVLRGGGGDDTVASRGGDDKLYGDEGSDHIVGGTGNDLLEGGAGNDILQGGASDAGTWEVVRNAQGGTFLRFAATETALTETPALFEQSAYAHHLGSISLADGRAAFLHTDMAKAETIALLYQAVLGRLPNNTEINHWAAQDLNYQRMGEIAWEAYAGEATHDTLESQVRNLIEQVWGSADAETIQAGIRYIEAGGSWAEGLLWLARHDNLKTKLTDGQGLVSIMQPLTLGETGWSADAGDDQIFGGAGNDLLIGSSGNNLLDGGEGIDLVVLPGNVAHDYRVGLQETAPGVVDLVIKNVFTGETNILRDVEFGKVGGVFYGPKLAGAPELKLGEFQLLADFVEVVGVAQMQEMGAPTSWF